MSWKLNLQKPLFCNMWISAMTRRCFWSKWLTILRKKLWNKCELRVNWRDRKTIQIEWFKSGCWRQYGTLNLYSRGQEGDQRFIGKKILRPVKALSWRWRNISGTAEYSLTQKVWHTAKIRKECWIYQEYNNSFNYNLKK